MEICGRVSIDGDTQVPDLGNEVNETFIQCDWKRERGLKGKNTYSGLETVNLM